MDKNKKTNKQPTNKKNDFTNAVEPTTSKKEKRNNNGAQNCR